MNNVIIRLTGIWLNLTARIAPAYAGRTGFKLICRPVRNRMKKWSVYYLNTAVKSSFRIGNTDIRMYRWGTGSRNVLFLHGWESDSSRWKQYIEALSKKDFSIYAIDAPGHGLSGGNFVNAALYGEVISMAASRIGTVHSIIGHSFGAFSALYALSHLRNMIAPGRVVIMGTPGRVRDFFDYFRKLLNLNETTMKVIDSHVEKKLGKPISYYKVENFGRNLEMPGLIIHDEFDDQSPFRYAEILHMNWPESRLLKMSGIGHNLRSDMVVQEVIRYVTDDVNISHPA